MKPEETLNSSSAGSPPLARRWVRTRTVKDECAPLWNEQYTWDVHEPSTVLTIGVFDNQHTRHTALEKARNVKDKPLGKVGAATATFAVFEFLC